MDYMPAYTCIVFGRDLEDRRAVRAYLRHELAAEGLAVAVDGDDLRPDAALMLTCATDEGAT